MYKKMYHNSRIPTLLGGSGGSLLPPELQACEYLETDGSSYIQTNIMPNRFKETLIKVEHFQQVENWFLGSRYTNTSRMYALFAPLDLGYLRCDFNSINNSTTRFSISTSLQQLIIHFNYWDNGTKKVSILDYSNNILDSKNLNDTAFGGAKEIPIFAGYATQSDLRLALSGTRVYYCIISDNTTNVKEIDLVSCYIKAGKTFVDNKSNTCPAGTCGMYDVVNHVFYTNDGTGNFACGPDINL